MITLQNGKFALLKTGFWFHRGRTRVTDIFSSPMNLPDMNLNKKHPKTITQNPVQRGENESIKEISPV